MRMYRVVSLAHTVALALGILAIRLWRSVVPPRR